MAISVDGNFPSPVFIGSTYTGSATASGGTAPYTYAVSAGALPDGLSLNAATGVVSGTVVALGTFDFTIQATDSVAATGTVDGEIVVASGIEAPAQPLPFRVPIKWGSDDCLKAGHQMARVFFNPIQTPKFKTTLAGNLQQPIGLVKSLYYNLFYRQARVASGDLQGATLIVEASQSLMRVALGPPTSLGDLNGNALADIWVSGACPFFATDETTISLDFGQGNAYSGTSEVDVRLFFCNWEISPFHFDVTDNWTD
jgi:hypothetical protein